MLWWMFCDGSIGERAGRFAARFLIYVLSWDCRTPDPSHPRNAQYLRGEFDWYVETTGPRYFSLVVILRVFLSTFILCIYTLVYSW